MPELVELWIEINTKVFFPGNKLKRHIFQEENDKYIPENILVTKLGYSFRSLYLFILVFIR